MSLEAELQLESACLEALKTLSPTELLSLVQRLEREACASPMQIRNAMRTTIKERAFNLRVLCGILLDYYLDPNRTK